MKITPVNWIAVGLVSFVLVSGCSNSDSKPVDTVEDASVSPSAEVTSSPSIKRVVYAQADFAHYFKDLTEMAQVHVVIGRVVAESDGEIPPGGDGTDGYAQIRRVITVDVSENLAGSQALERFDVVTPGWVIEEGKRVPLSYEGWPWLQVGDEVLLAVDDSSQPGDYGFASDSGVQVVRDGRIIPVPGVTSALSKELVGMSKDDLRRAFAGAAK